MNCAPGSYQAIETVLIEIENNTSILNPICVPCQMGYYQNAQGQVACTACPAGYTTRNTSSHLPEDCYKECDKGYYSSNGLEPCSRCPNGTYSPESGLTMCISCTQFNYTITGYCDIPKRECPHAQYIKASVCMYKLCSRITHTAHGIRTCIQWCWAILSIIEKLLYYVVSILEILISLPLSYYSQL